MSHDYVTCKDCDRANPTTTYDAYECRRRSPMLLASQPTDGRPADQRPVWPIVHGDDWCAEVRRRVDVAGRPVTSGGSQ